MGLGPEQRAAGDACHTNPRPPPLPIKEAASPRGATHIRHPIRPSHAQHSVRQRLSQQGTSYGSLPGLTSPRLKRSIERWRFVCFFFQGFVFHFHDFITTLGLDALGVVDDLVPPTAKTTKLANVKEAFQSAVMLAGQGSDDDKKDCALHIYHAGLVRHSGAHPRRVP